MITLRRTCLNRSSKKASETKFSPVLRWNVLPEWEKERFHWECDAGPRSITLTGFLTSREMQRHARRESRVWLAGHSPPFIHSLLLFSSPLPRSQSSAQTFCFIFSVLPFVPLSVHLSGGLQCGPARMSRGCWWGYGYSIAMKLNEECSTPHLSAHTVADRRLIMRQMAVNGPQTAGLIWKCSSP